MPIPPPVADDEPKAHRKTSQPLQLLVTILPPLRQKTQHQAQRLRRQKSRGRWTRNRRRQRKCAKNCSLMHTRDKLVRKCQTDCPQARSRVARSSVVAGFVFYDYFFLVCFSVSDCISLYSRLIYSLILRLVVLVVCQCQCSVCFLPGDTHIAGAKMNHNQLHNYTYTHLRTTAQGSYGGCFRHQ